MMRLEGQVARMTDDKLWLENLQGKDTSKTSA
jgi:hypothetical protein